MTDVTFQSYFTLNEYNVISTVKNLWVVDFSRMEEYNVNGEPAKRRDCVKRDQPDKINVVAAFVSL